MSRPVRSAGAAGFLLIAAVLLPLGAPIRPAAAAPECLAAPDGTATAGRRWFYRLDRTTKRKCWYLRDREAETRPTDTTGALPATGAAAACPVVPAVPVTSAAGTGATASAATPPALPAPGPATGPAGRPLTADERAALYAEFLAWRLSQMPPHDEPDGSAAAAGSHH